MPQVSHFVNANCLCSFTSSVKHVGRTSKLRPSPIKRLWQSQSSGCRDTTNQKSTLLNDLESSKTWEKCIRRKECVSLFSTFFTKYLATSHSRCLQKHRSSCNGSVVLVQIVQKLECRHLIVKLHIGLHENPFGDSSVVKF